MSPKLQMQPVRQGLPARLRDCSGRSPFTAFAALLVLGIAGLGLTIPTAPRTIPKTQRPEALANSPAKARVLASYGQLPLSFEPCVEANCGGSDGSANFVARGRGYTLFLTPAEAVLNLRPSGGRSPDLSNRPEHRMEARAGKPTPPQPPTVMRMKLVGADPSSRWEALEELPGKSNYFLGNAPKKWRTNVANYAKVRYRDVYPGIDLIYYGNQGQLEYDFVLAPGADPRLIELAFEGAEKLRVDTEGDLVVQFGGKELRLRQPLVYQVAKSGRQEIVGRYVRRGKTNISFELAAYDPKRIVVIDPVLVYSTFLGGNRGDQGVSIAADFFGNAYITGNTNSTDFPTTAGAFDRTCGTDGECNPGRRPPSPPDIFVTKVNPNGSALVYSTYLGGSGEEQESNIAVDASGDAYVAGGTLSDDFPRTANALAIPGAPRGFVTKFSGSGTLIYSAVLDSVWGNGIAVDQLGNAYVTGTNWNSQSCGTVVAKLNPTASTLLYSTCLPERYGFDIAVDSSGNAYVAGGWEDAFLAKLNPAGSGVYLKVLGGSGQDYPFAIAVDAAGNAYVTGRTGSVNFPVTPGAFQTTITSGISNVDCFRTYCLNTFTTKLSPTGSLVYSTYFGGLDIAVDSSGRVYVTRGTSTYGTIVKFTDDGTSFGDLVSVEGMGTYAMALDALDNFYLTGRQNGPFQPTTGVFQPYSNGADAVIAKVAIRTPAQMAERLMNIAANFNFQQGIRLLQNTLAAINVGNVRVACNQLEAFLNQVQAQSGKQLTATQAAQLTGAATQIRAALGCP